MSGKIRVFKPNVVYSVVINTVDNSPFFKPDHDTSHPLLVQGCSVESFERFNKIAPNPSVINIIGVAAARAQDLAPVNVHWVEATSNKIQTGISATYDQLKNISSFFRNFHSYIAVKTGKKWKWDGHIFASKYSATPCLDDLSVEQQLVGCVTSPLKEGLVERVEESPYFTTFMNLTKGEKLEYFRIDWESYNNAGAGRKKSHCPQDYLEWLRLEITPIPGQDDWPEQRRQTWARAQIRKAEDEMPKGLEEQCRTAMGVSFQFRQNSWRKGNTLKKAGSKKKPLCYSTNLEAAGSFKKQWRETISLYRDASEDYRSGEWDRKFPEGTYRPPLIKLCQTAYS